MRKLYTALVLTLMVLPLVAQNIPSYVPKDGLVGYWPFNGNANDESGNGNNGTVNGATLTADRNGVVNSAYSFDGNDDYINAGTDTVFALTNTKNLCFSFWAKNISTNRYFISKYENFQASNYGIANNQGQLRVTGNGENVLDCSTMEGQDWNHYVVIFKGTSDSVYCYKDNVLVGQSSLIYSPTISNIPLIFGGLYGAGSLLMSGKLDDIAIYNRALNEKEITALYTSTPIANVPSYMPKDGLVGYWPFNGNANDESGNGNNGTVNGATLTADRNGVANSAFNFINVNDYIEIPTANKKFNNQQYTISLWFKSNANNSSVFGGPKVNPSIISRCSEQSNIYDNFVVFEINGGINFNSGKSAQVAAGYITDTKIFNNNWQNIIFSISNDSSRTYLNGIKVYTQEINGTIDFLDVPIRLGKSRNLYWKDFEGIIDELGYWNRSLTSEEVKKIFDGCIHEKAISNSFNSILLPTSTEIKLSAEPQGGVFSGTSIENNQFIPSKAKIGSNKVKYNFKNSQGCADSTLFTMVVADTVGTSCTKYDTITVKNNVYDTVKVTKYDTLKVTKFDTVTITNNITKYDTITVKNNVYDTVKVTKYDTLKVTKFDTVTITNSVTKYDTVIVKTNVFDTVKVTKYDTLTVKNNIYDTVSILKIKFKLTTGIHANQLSSLSIYPNPTSDVLYIEVSDAKALEGYRYRILDALGKEVYNQLVTQSATEIPLKTLGAAGIYQFEILDANKTSIQSNKIVLQ